MALLEEDASTATSERMNRTPMTPRTGVIDGRALGVEPTFLTQFGNCPGKNCARALNSMPVPVVPPNHALISLLCDIPAGRGPDVNLKRTAVISAEEGRDEQR